jgi:hypothetical protein
MAIKKEYSRDKKSCKITFSIPKDLGNKFHTISLLGDFNNWDPNTDIFTEIESDGTYSTTMVLPSGKEYQFRYLGDGVHWFNDNEADKEVETYFEGSKNSVIVI